MFIGQCARCGSPAALACTVCGRTFCHGCLDEDERTCNDCLQTQRRGQSTVESRQPPSRRVHRSRPAQGRIQ